MIDYTNARGEERELTLTFQQMMAALHELSEDTRQNQRLRTPLTPPTPPAVSRSTITTTHITTSSSQMGSSSKTSSSKTHSSTPHTVPNDGAAAPPWAPPRAPPLGSSSHWDRRTLTVAALRRLRDLAIAALAAYPTTLAEDKALLAGEWWRRDSSFKGDLGHGVRGGVAAMNDTVVASIIGWGEKQMLVHAVRWTAAGIAWLAEEDPQAALVAGLRGEGGGGEGGRGDALPSPWYSPYDDTKALPILLPACSENILGQQMDGLVSRVYGAPDWLALPNSVPLLVFSAADEYKGG